ncbi:MASE1 domain-containing protein [Caenispirillum salinarum]|uniref:MASE1 domain-containing protein n=1 Tax=Caenispirillum salinarum TaxID=859058 RepID=UPI00384C8B10
MGLTQRIGLHIGLAGLYFATAKLGLAMAFVGGNVSAVWIPSGLATAALVIGGLRFAPAMWAGAFAATLHTGVSVAVAAGIATGNTAEYVLAWAVLRTALSGRPVTLARVPEILVLTAAAVLAPSVAALVGTASLCLGGVAPWEAFPSIVTTYWLGDSAGILMVAPFIIAWTRAGRRLRGLPELALACIVAAGASAVVFSDALIMNTDNHVFAYAVFPFIIWGALRHGVRGAATVALVVAVPAVVATAQGIGLFARPDQTESLVLLQSFMTVTALTGLITAAAVSERDEAARQTRLLSHAVEQSATSVMVTDPDGHLVYVNPAFTDLTGYALGDVAGQTPRFLKSGHTRHEEYEALWRAVKAGETWRGEFLNRTRDGGTVWEAATISPVRETDGHISHLVATKEDITERKRQENDLRRALTQHARAKRELERIAYAVTHTLQEPLRAIGGFTQLLERRYGDRLDETGRGYLAHVRAGTNRMSRLFRDLMDYALIDEPTAPDGAVDLNETAATAIVNCRAGGAVSVSGPLPVVRGHAGQMRMVFQHLIDNGMAYAKPGASPDIHIEARADGDGWRVTVRDAGIGIDPVFHEKLFALFSRLHTDDEVAGSGVGLAYCRRVLERQGGRIWLDSVPGDGTSVHLWLPDGRTDPETTPA